jgi:6-phosphogluconolactonase (cycloisomerase 2 family)
MKSNQVIYVANIFQRLGGRLLFAALFLVILLVSNNGAALAAGNRTGAVFVMTNAADGNAVLVFDRAVDGTLTEVGEVPTGGLGAGSGLGSQGALVLNENQRLLFAVNAGSDEISAFLVRSGGLSLADTVPSGGDMPISLTVHGNLLYVLNAGGSGNITGFTVDRGQLTPLAGSTQPLSNGGVGSAPGPAQISFTPDGQQLVVTEKDSNSILTYTVGADGLASAPTVHPSAGITPFGFAFNRRGYLIISEAFGGAPDASAASSYILNESDLQVISPSVPTHQTAACWVVVTGNGKYAYTTNTGSGSVSGYQVGRDGTLTLLDADGVTGDTGPGSSPTDAALSVGSRYLYVLNSGAHTVAVFQVNGDGSLDPLGEVSIPAGAVGLAAR